jgi:hypothetical protein
MREQNEGLQSSEGEMGGWLTHTVAQITPSCALITVCVFAPKLPTYVIGCDKAAKTDKLHGIRYGKSGNVHLTCRNADSTWCQYSFILGYNIDTSDAPGLTGAALSSSSVLSKPLASP